MATAEQIAKQSLHAGMNQRLHYKEIYQMAKERVNDYAETVKMPQLSTGGITGGEL